MRGHYGQTKWAATNQLSGRGIVVFHWTRFIWQNVPFDNTTPIYLIDLLWKLGLGLGLNITVALFSHFSRKITKWSTLYSANFT